MTLVGVSGIILAGGRSSRFGRDKAFAEIDGRPLIEIIIAEFSEIFPEIIVVANRNAAYRRLAVTEIVPDIKPDLGPIGGILTGVSRMTNNYGFFAACDTPFFEAEIMRQQFYALDPFAQDALVARWPERIEPLHALYGKACLPAIEKAIEQNRRKIISFHDQIKVAYWDVPPERDWQRYFRNFNTEDELNRETEKTDS
jgi:molybdenum cofactor guanylyltransferase